MESSDEDGEIVPDFITNYYLVDSNGDPVSFANLPLQWSNTEIPNSESTEMNLCGTSDCGLQKIFKRVLAWRLELSYAVPEIYIFSKDKMWIKIAKPRKSFLVIIKPILVSVHFIHFLKKNPETSEDAVWNYLLKTLSSFEVEPSRNDLLDHISLIKTAKMMDKDIANSKYLTAFLREISGEKEAFDEEDRTTKFSVLDGGDYCDGGGGDDDGDDYEDEIFDHVCAICDNGGAVLACEGRCIRSFHATVDAAGVESFCESLGYTDAQVDAIQNFLCKNCQRQQHQCFACGMLGSSTKSSGAEVFSCVSATCGHFYHPKCVAELLHPTDKTQAKELGEKILAGESFICPAHKCAICKHGEDKKIKDLQFALCRRCPKAYHRKCLPRKIAFQVNDENSHQRAWDGLLPNRILIYCMDHKIVPELGTPARNHIKFPDGDGRRKDKEKVLDSNKINFLGNLTGKSGGKNIEKPVERTRVSVQSGNLKSFKDKNMSILGNVNKSSSLVDKSKSSLRINQSNNVASIKSSLNKSKQQSIASEITSNMLAAKSKVIKASTLLPSVDAATENRILTLMNTSTASFNMEEFVESQRRLSTSSYSSKVVVDKTITKGKVEGSVKAIRAALKKLEEGSSVEDAKAVCEPEILKQTLRWKRKLGSYLAPFLNGMRYTSFGRHFTKVDKLKEIVERVQWYVQDGDIIVDFCCGSNDFSLLMKEKLEKMRKNCSFKNFDLIIPKNDFNFEKRDWMTVGVGELPEGSNLIMGLNPPFGDRASGANKFIEKALKFKPKLLVLIVPKETKRLNKYNPPYDIVWEDDEMLAGKAFYLPGSIDIHNQQMDQWNLNTPPLYLWSRPDWTARHIEIAKKHGHLHEDQGNFSDVIKGCNGISLGQDGKSQAGKWDSEEKFDDDMEISPANSPMNC